MNERKSILKAAFPRTIPVLTGYLFLGLTYGIFMSSKGFSFLYPMLISVVVFAGSMQFVLVNVLLGAFNPLGALLLTLMVNARHLFYGAGMLEKYRDLGPSRWYMIFGLTDETFSINVSAEPPPGMDRGRFMFYITLLDQCYWVAGATVGGLVGAAIKFDSSGIDFVMTALFVVIFLDQWLTGKGHASALIGVAASALCLFSFGSGNFILPAMALILVLLIALRKPLDRERLP